MKKHTSSNQRKNHIKIIDAIGLTCPEPLMLVHKAIFTMQAGEQLCLKADDPATERDLKHFCQYLGHSFINQQNHPHHSEYVIQKRID